MLPGFEEITQDLSDYEKTHLLPVFVASLGTKHGAHHAITNKEIIKALANRRIVVKDAQVRKIISYIRSHGLLPGLVASSKGYYVTVDPDEMSRYIESLEGRETKIRLIKHRMIEYRKQLLSGRQTPLFT
jgi:hypothetical protein